jgi:hypothetical protein
VDGCVTPADELKSATDAVLLIRQRDARAWPIAEVLATMWRDGCLKRLLNSTEYRAWTPVLETEADLHEVFGSPADADRRNRRGRAA